MSTFNAALLEGVNARDVTLKDNQLIAIAQLMGNIYFTGLPTPVQLSEEAKALAQNKADTIRLRWGPHFPEKNPEFVGREKIRNTLQRHFTRNSESSSIQVLAGLGGAGKTQVASKYAWDESELKYYNLIAWLSFTQDEGYFSDFRDLGSRLNVKLQDRESRYNLIMRIKKELAKIPRVLLIFDDANTFEEIKPYVLLSSELNSHHCFHAIATSRNSLIARNQRGFPITAIETDFLDLDESTQYITHCLRDNPKFTQLSPTEQTQQAEELSTTLENFPLALAQAVAYIRETDNTTIENYLTTYRENHAILLRQDKIPNDIYQAAVSTTWKSSMDAIEKKQPIAATLLRLCAFLNAERIPYDLAQTLANQMTCNNSEGPSRVDLRGEIISLWRAYSLISIAEDGSFFKMHQIVQMVIQDALNQDQKEQYLEQLLIVLNRELKDDIYSLENLLTNRELLSHSKCIFYNCLTPELQLIETKNELVIEVGKKTAMTYLELRECQEAINLFTQLIKLSGCHDIDIQLKNIIMNMEKVSTIYKHNRRNISRAREEIMHTETPTVLEIQAPFNAEMSFLFEQLALAYLHLDQYSGHKLPFVKKLYSTIDKRTKIKTDIENDLACSLLLLKFAITVNRYLTNYDDTRVVLNLCELAVIAKKINKLTYEMEYQEHSDYENWVIPLFNLNFILSQILEEQTNRCMSFRESLSEEFLYAAFELKVKVWGEESDRSSDSLLDAAKKMLTKTKMKGNRYLLRVLLSISDVVPDTSVRADLLNLTLLAAKEYYGKNSIRVAEIQITLAKCLTSWLKSSSVASMGCSYGFTDQIEEEEAKNLCEEALIVVAKANCNHPMIFQIVDIIVTILTRTRKNIFKLYINKKSIDILINFAKKQFEVNTQLELQYASALILALTNPSQDLALTLASFFKSILMTTPQTLIKIQESVYAIGYLNITHDQIIEVLASQLSNSKLKVRSCVYDALNRLGKLNHYTVLNASLDNLTNTDKIDFVIVRILCEHGKTHYEHVVSVLRDKLENKNMHCIWGEAVKILDEIGFDLEETKAIVSKWSDDESNEVKQGLYLSKSNSANCQKS